MPRFVLHIGPSKTGTTYLQESLRLARPMLASHGIAYPLDWWPCRLPLNHKYVFEEIRSPRGDRLPVAIEAARASTLETVVLSYEGFVELRHGELIGLRRMLGAAEVNVVFYFRRWCERIPSSWHQVVRGGSTRDFPDHVMRMTLYSDRLRTINYAMMLDKFADVFGRDCLKLISYNHLIHRKDDLFEQFCRSVLGIDVRGALPVKHRNESADILDTEIHRVLNVLEAMEAGSNRNIGSDHPGRVRSVLAGTDLSWLKQRMTPHLAELKLSDRAPAFLPIYDDLTKRYLDKLINPVEDNSLFHRTTRTVQYVRPDYLLHKGTCEFISDMHQRVKAAA